MTYWYLAAAVVAEVIATSALQATNEFTRLWPSLLVVVSYSTAFYFLTLVFRTLPLGVTYALWSGLGIVLVTLAGLVVYRQVPDLPAVIGIALIIAGVVVINLFSRTTAH